MSHRKGWQGLILVVLLVVLLAGCQKTEPEIEVDTRAGGTAATTFRNVRILNDLTVEDDAAVNGVLDVVGAVTVDDLDVGDDLTVTDDATVGGDTTLSGLFKLGSATSVTVTNGAAFAIAGAWQPITAAGAVTPTITIPAAGVSACIVNNSAQTVLIVDTGNQVLTANFSMGQYDVLCGHSDGTRFIETSRANN